MTDYPRCARPGQGGHEWERMERDMERLFGKFRQPMRPDDEPIPGREDLGEPAHINTWRENKGAIR